MCFLVMCATGPANKSVYQLIIRAPGPGLRMAYLFMQSLFCMLPDSLIENEQCFPMTPEVRPHCHDIEELHQENLKILFYTFLHFFVKKLKKYEKDKSFTCQTTF